MCINILSFVLCMVIMVASTMPCVKRYTYSDYRFIIMRGVHQKSVSYCRFEKLNIWLEE